MNCFVIMPFTTDFDDVYDVIKTTVETAAADMRGRCFRLDESRPAGRITDRLLTELRAATICVADLTGTKPNVMWELGFAMALGKPTIIVTQRIDTLPFDIQDMQSIEYSRNRLSVTLSPPLKRSLLDTFGALSATPHSSSDADAATVGTLLKEISELKSMVAGFVSALKADDAKVPQPSQLELQTLAGHWFNTESGSHIYSRMVRGELVSPYCYGADTHLTGVYFGWRRTGEYWFARYQWRDSSVSGFSFLRMESVEKMTGAWWSSEEENQDADAPPRSAGVSANWVKQAGTPTPSWAEELFRKVEVEGLASLLTMHREGTTFLQS